MLRGAPPPSRAHQSHRPRCSRRSTAPRAARESLDRDPRLRLRGLDPRSRARAGRAIASFCSNAAVIRASRSASRRRRSRRSRSSASPQRFGLDDLDSLAAYGRWRRDLPHLRRGLKRGLHVLRARAGRALSQQRARRAAVCWSRPAPTTRSPTRTGCAPTSISTWRCAAAAAGAELLEETEVTDVAPARRGGFRLELRERVRRHRGERSLDVTHVIDGSGRAGVLARRFAAARRVPTAFETTLLGAHLEGVDTVRPGRARRRRRARARSLSRSLRRGASPAARRLGLRPAVRSRRRVGRPGGLGRAARRRARRSRSRVPSRHRAPTAPSPNRSPALASSVPFQCSHPLPHRSLDAAGDGLGAAAAHLRVLRSALLRRHRLEPARGRAAGRLGRSAPRRLARRRRSASSIATGACSRARRTTRGAR